jgi:HPt (histidine-containing phosphotransfer) domain-containing protein
METVRHRVLVSGELRDLIPRFLDNRRLEVRQLRDAIARNDLEAARRIGHGLKGVGGGYGFDAITRLGAEIEHCARAGGVGLDALVRDLAEYLENVDITYTAD